MDIDRLHQLGEDTRFLQEQLAGHEAGAIVVGRVVEVVGELREENTQLELRSAHLEAENAQKEAELAELRAEKERLIRESRTDSLTGLANRRAFNEAVEWESAQVITDHGSDRPKVVGRALAMIDLDGFKDINDTLGHEVGDRSCRHRP